MSYYDIDAILTDAQKVPCKFEITVPHGGYLDGNPGQDMKEGSRIELPFWLSSVLSSGISRLTSTTAISLDVPTSLSRRVINALIADPRSVDLRAQAPHFYGLAALVFELLEDEETVDVLIDTFKARAAKIADHAHNPFTATTAFTGSGGGTGSSASSDAEFLRGLEDMERQLFRAAHDGAKGVRTWIAEGKRP